jgi:hypothetical protein
LTWSAEAVPAACDQIRHTQICDFAVFHLEIITENSSQEATTTSQLKTHLLNPAFPPPLLAAAGRRAASGLVV